MAGGARTGQGQVTGAPLSSETRRREGLHAAWEAFIVLLVCLNLGLILFDSLFQLVPINLALNALVPELHRLYAETVHAHFQFIDLAFVAVFILDVLLGWTVAVVEKRYPRWYYYPFTHWYDVLGCIPLSGMRWLRALRILVLAIRLQRLGLIDMRTWAIYGFFNRYYQLLLEELSDRVMVRLFSRLQQEIGTSDDLTRRLVDGVIRPRKERLIADLSRRLEAMLQEGYHGNRAAIEAHVTQLVRRALAENRELARLRRLPLGDRLAESLDDALTGIARSLLHGSIDGLQSDTFKATAARLADACFDAWLYQDEDTDLALEELLVDSIEVLKQQILDRRWSRFVGPEPPPTPPE